MTFVGVRIENGELEVGFKVATRRECEENQRLVAAAVDLLWPAEIAEPDLSRDPAEPPQEGDFARTPTTRDFGEPMETWIKRWDEGREWLRRQGLAGADDGAVA